MVVKTDAFLGKNVKRLAQIPYLCHSLRYFMFVRLPAKVFDVAKQYLFGYKRSEFFNRSDAMLSKFPSFSLKNLLFFNHQTLSQEVYYLMNLKV